jgi:diacylglycerol kinase (ATP)
VPRSFSLIVNPAAGGGRSLRILPAATTALAALGLNYRVVTSWSLEHGRELAAAAGRDGDAVVAVGGDGMAGALAGVAAAGSATFGIIPAGRGNDLARVLGIPFSPREAAVVLARGEPRQMDLIGAQIPGQPELVAAGSVYAGLPSVAGELANAARWLRGPLVYPVSALRVLATWQAVGFRLESDRGGHDLPGQRDLPGRHEFPGCAVVIANLAYFGAGMMVAPPALADDGLLDVVMMRDGSRLGFVRVLLKIRNGTHVRLARVTLDRAAAVTLTMDRAMPVAADGEVLPGAAPLPAGTPLTVRAMPSALTVLAPPPG